MGTLGGHLNYTSFHFVGGETGREGKGWAFQGLGWFPVKAATALEPFLTFAHLHFLIFLQ